MRATCSIAISIWTQSQGHDQGLLFKDKDKDCIVKDKDRTRTRTNITAGGSPIANELNNTMTAAAVGYCVQELSRVDFERNTQYSVLVL